MKPVRFPVPCETAYDYLVDPANRPAWQSSLRAVADVVGENGVVGQHWTDVTKPGLRPHMELTVADRPHRWTERGTWRGISAELTLTFTPVGQRAGEGCDVVAEMSLRGRGIYAVPALGARLLAPREVRRDLVRAAGLVAVRDS